MSISRKSSNSPRSSEVFLTENELSARQNRSVKTLQAERLTGRGVPFVKFGRSVRYRLSDIEAFEVRCLRRSSTDGRACNE